MRSTTTLNFTGEIDLDCPASGSIVSDVVAEFMSSQGVTYSWSNPLITFREVEKEGRAGRGAPSFRS